ncbi:MAG: exopolysaccharide biosynthesis polyprenyl glycosylphosphotransferase, partial [Nocardioidaceae bacterium]
VVVVGRHDGVEVLIEDLLAAGCHVVAACLADWDGQANQVGRVPVWGGLSQVAGIADSFSVDDVVVDIGVAAPPEWLRKLQWDLEDSGARLHLSTGLVKTRPERAQARSIGNRLTVEVAASPPPPLVARVKAVLEASAALLILILTAPACLACMLAIKLESRGPILFRQVRVRESGRTFNILKLRTMRVDAEQLREQLEDQNESDGALFKIKDDPRVTRVGKVLRRFSLDELPQLVNIIKGDMALIGPRPALVSEVEEYDDSARRRLAVKPGLTGLWQVSGRSGLTWAQSVEVDIDYVDNWSAGRDIAIAAKTAKVVITRDGAY